MEHRQGEDVPHDGTSEESRPDVMIPVDDRIVLFIACIGIVIDVLLIMGIVSCVRHIANHFPVH